MNADDRTPLVTLVVDRRTGPSQLAEAVAQAVAGGVGRVQLRERELEGAAWLAWAEELAEAARSASPACQIIVNRRLDVAIALDADGVHLGFDAVSIADARRLLGPEALIGVSTHTPDEAEARAREGANYVHLAPIFAPLSKPATRPELGLAAIEVAHRGAPTVIAQGGLSADNAGAAIARGAAGIAVTGTLLAADDPRTAAEALLSAAHGRERSPEGRSAR